MDKEIKKYHFFSWYEADYLRKWLQMMVSEGLTPIEIGYVSAVFTTEGYVENRRYIVLQMPSDYSYDERSKIQEQGWIPVTCSISNVLVFYTDNQDIPVPDADRKLIASEYSRKQKNLLIAMAAVVMAFLGIIYETKKSVSLLNLDGGLFYVMMSVSGLILGTALIISWLRQYLNVSDAIDRLGYSGSIDDGMCIMRKSRNARIFISLSAAIGASIVLFILSFVMINLHG